MHGADDEREVARPNDTARAAVLEVLDLADRAGVRLTYVNVFPHDGDPGPSVHVQGGGTGQHMTSSDALRIALRAGSRDTVERYAPEAPRTATSVVVTTRSGVVLTILCEPTREQLEAAVVEAVLQS